MGERFNELNQVQETASVYAVVEGIPIALPDDAKCIVQDKRGCWFYCKRKPRIKHADWTPNKVPIQLRDHSGNLLPQVLKTNSFTPWQDSMQLTVKKAQLPQ